MQFQQYQQFTAQVDANGAMNNRWPRYMVWFALGFRYIAPTQSTTEPMAIFAPTVGSLCDPMLDSQIKKIGVLQIYVKRR